MHVGLFIKYFLWHMIAKPALSLWLPFVVTNLTYNKYIRKGGILYGQTICFILPNDNADEQHYERSRRAWRRLSGIAPCCDLYIVQLNALHLPQEIKQLIDDCVSGHVAVGSCFGRLAYLQGFQNNWQSEKIGTNSKSCLCRYSSFPPNISIVSVQLIKMDVTKPA